MAARMGCVEAESGGAGWGPRGGAGTGVVAQADKGGRVLSSDDILMGDMVPNDVVANL